MTHTATRRQSSNLTPVSDDLLAALCCRASNVHVAEVVSLDVPLLGPVSDTQLDRRNATEMRDVM